MIRVTKKTVFIYDIKDKSKQKIFLDNARKKQKLTLEEFNKKYKYTPQRFYYRSFFKKFLALKFPNRKVKFFNLPSVQEDSKFGFCLTIT